MENIMPQLIEGRWVSDEVAANEMRNGAFHREETKFRDAIAVDGRAGYPAEAGRYKLFVSYMCPWASRTLIMRTLKGLENLIPVSYTSLAGIGDNGWEYPEPQDTGERTPDILYQHQLYTLSEPRYSGKVSVPVLWDLKTGRIVNNESSEIIRMLNTAFDGITGNRLDFYPEHLRATIDEWNALIYDTVNNGVYKSGFARTQSSYEDAVKALFSTLDKLEGHLSQNRYIAGEYMTEADIRLFVTLIRFDAAYVGAFKCNIRRIADYPNLSGYLREMYQWPGIADTVKIDQIKHGYFSISFVNPTKIVPVGPHLDFTSSHGREGLLSKGIYKRA
jgi:putative glutathione S-transferase